jgi:hypothetical protein
MRLPVVVVVLVIVIVILVAMLVRVRDPVEVFVHVKVGLVRMSLLVAVHGGRLREASDPFLPDDS